jgi:hypothetical protein
MHLQEYCAENLTSSQEGRRKWVKSYEDGAGVEHYRRVIH